MDNLDYYNGSAIVNWGSEYLTLHEDELFDQITHGEGISGYDGVEECAHSDSGDEKLNCTLKGSAAWYLFARLTGWDGN